MRSGNGRHRRPRQVPAIVVTAGVTGSALALPLLAATGASAAETSTWDKVAECESGGTWSANFGSGAYGGLQFTEEQWKGAGGLDFAPRADLASRSQQIAVAERVLAAQGPQAWPMCAASAGLTQQAPAADVDPGTPGSRASVAPSPSRPDDSVPVGGSGDRATDFGAPTQTSPSPSGTPSFLLPDVPLGPPSGLPVMPDPVPDLPTTAPATPVAPVDPAAPSTGPSAPTTAPVAPTTPAAPGTPSADPSAPATPGAPGTPGAPAEGGGKHRGEPAVEAPVASDAASEPKYTVKEGDSLAAIADANDLKGGWNALYAANEQVIGEDANLIKPGQNLDLTQK
ncbi:transglycosylase family protein [Streptomyces sp. NPDC048340]|uniref:LysM peptidoglycan-binding domain-containing protein n=1 Tax=Streptomyces sp. NPDC048340 TaxID=3365537 RepID=UPI003711E2FA